MRRSSIASFLGFAAALLAGVSYQSMASASIVLIANNSFEDESLPYGVWNHSIQDWTQGGSWGDGIGTWHPDPSWFDLSTLDGVQSAFLWGGRMAQQLTTRLVLGEEYRLSALFGAISWGGDFMKGGSLELWAGGAVADGEVIGGVLLGALTVNNADLVSGKFVPFQAEINAPSSGSLGGELLSIRFVSNGVESEIDNIQLESASSAVPEPCTLVVWSLLGASGVGFGCWRRRR